MKGNKYVFSQLTDFLEKRIFDGIVAKYNGDKGSGHFSCWNQMLVMMFGQFASCDSLRDLTSVINAHTKKSYHLGFGKSVSEVIFQWQMRIETAKYLKILLCL